MNVTLFGFVGQAAFWHRRPRLFLALAPTLLSLAIGPLAAETHSNLQAVTSMGVSAWSGSFPFTLRGVLLCNPDEMLDATPSFLPWNEGANQYRMGAEWQVTFQAVDPGDWVGTTCWMGQNYGNQPWIHDSELSYTNEARVAEILRLNFDPSNLRQFRAGDLVEMTMRQALFYGGQRNINEGHDIDPAYDFDIHLGSAESASGPPGGLASGDCQSLGAAVNAPTIKPWACRAAG